jgi:CheY-like chemotaxis protein
MAKAKILVVEDNPLNRELFAAMLEPEGYEVVMAADAREGIDLAISEAPDLVLMDIGLPVIDGLEATRRLRQTAATAGLKIVVVSAHALESDRRRAEAAGCDGFVTKPIRRAELLLEIRRHLVTS